jgi:hypothetical protein
VNNAQAPREITLNDCENLFSNERLIAGGSALTGLNDLMTFGPDNAGSQPAEFKYAADYGSSVVLPRKLFTMRGNTISSSLATRDSTSAQVKLIVHFHTRTTDSSYQGSVAEYLLSFIKTFGRPMVAQKVLVSSAKDGTSGSGLHAELDINSVVLIPVSDSEVDVFFNTTTSATTRVLTCFAEVIQFGRSSLIAERMQLLRA